MSARALRRNARVPGARRQRGLALLVAIILVALGTMIAATIGYENAMTARRGARDAGVRSVDPHRPGGRSARSLRVEANGTE